MNDATQHSVRIVNGQLILKKMPDHRNVPKDRIGFFQFDTVAGNNQLVIELGDDGKLSLWLEGRPTSRGLLSNKIA
jgi:hypothetical protein